MALRRHAHSDDTVGRMETTPVTLASEEVDASTYVPLGGAQNELWDYYEQLGEVHYPLNLGGNIASKVDAGLQVRDSDGAWHAPLHQKGRTMKLARQSLDIVNANPVHDMFRRFWLLVSVPGQSHLLMQNDSFGEMHLEVLSTDEVRVDTSGTIWRQGSRTSGFSEQVKSTAKLYRLWRPSPRYSRDPDPALQCVLVECRELHLLKMSLLARIQSRLASQGILFLPNSLNIPGVQSVDGTDVVAQKLRAVFEANKKNPGGASAAAPILIRGNAEDGQHIRHIILSTELTKEDQTAREELRKVIAQGIELPTAKQNNDQAVNHWGAWAIDESALVDHVLPHCQTLLDQFTRRVMWPLMRMDGMSEREVRDVRFYADPTQAAAAALRSEGSRQLYDRNLIGAIATRRMNGVSEDDAPTTDEIVRWIGMKTNNPMLMTWGLDVVIPEEAFALGAPDGPGGFDADPAMVTPEEQFDPESGIDQS